MSVFIYCIDLYVIPLHPPSRHAPECPLEAFCELPSALAQEVGGRLAALAALRHGHLVITV